MSAHYFFLKDKKIGSDIMVKKYILALQLRVVKFSRFSSSIFFINVLFTNMTKVKNISVRYLEVWF